MLTRALWILSKVKESYIVTQIRRTIQSVFCASAWPLSLKSMSSLFQTGLSTIIMCHKADLDVDQIDVACKPRDVKTGA